MTLRVEQLTIDCTDPEGLAHFWQRVLGGTIQYYEDEPLCEILPDEGGLGLLFIVVPEPKVAKNRLHLDLRPDDQAAEVSRLEALGATRVDVGQSVGDNWVVLADPEGNEFCVLHQREQI